MALTQGSRQSIPQKLQIPCLYNLFSSMPYMCLHCGTHIFAIKRGKKLKDLIQGRIKLKSFVDRLNQSQCTFHVHKVLNTVAKTFSHLEVKLSGFKALTVAIQSKHIFTLIVWTKKKTQLVCRAAPDNLWS